MPTDDDIATCVAGELRLLDPDFRRSPEAGTLLDADFREFGSSGRVWDRASILAMLSQDDAAPPLVADVDGTALSPDIVLVTYRSDRPGRSTLRSSIWRRRDGRWSLVFHQGTVAVGDQPWCG